MQKPPRVSLNAVRVFVVAAQRRSIALAAESLSVTPGAVSHQIKRLEGELGIRLFRRGNNSIDLTQAGLRFQEDCTPALAIIDRSASRLRRNADEITIRVPMSLGIRWLIPALERFKKIHPAARVRVETANTEALAPGDPSDVVIYYQRGDDTAGQGEVIASDLSQAVLSPELLRASRFPQSRQLRDLPVLQCAAGNWDWKLWLEKHGLPDQEIAITHTFDTDDAAIRAAAAGLGVALSTTFLTAGELRSGSLVVLPGFAPVELGCYKLLLHPEPSRMASNFRDWLRQEISAATATAAS